MIELIQMPLGFNLKQAYWKNKGMDPYQTRFGYNFFFGFPKWWLTRYTTDSGARSVLSTESELVSVAITNSGGNSFAIKEILDIDATVEALMADDLAPKFSRAVLKLTVITPFSEVSSAFASEVIFGLLKRKVGTTYTDDTEGTTLLGVIDSACSGDYAFKTLKSINLQSFGTSIRPSDDASCICFGGLDAVEFSNILNQVRKKHVGAEFENTMANEPEYSVVAIVKGKDNGVNHHINSELTIEYEPEPHKANIPI